MLTTGVGLRLIGLTQPPLDFAATRQYHSVLIASNYFHDWWEVGSERDRRVAATAAKAESTLEPPLLEAVTAAGFRMTGGEYLWLPRLLSILFWVGGAVLLYRLARRLASAEGALLAVAYFMFVPFGILASRAFQPDPLMIMLFLTAVLASVRYDERPTLPRLGVAGGVAAAALLIKPGVLGTFLVSVFLALLIARIGFRKAVTSFPLVGFIVLSLSPVLGYYAYGTYVRNFLDGQVDAKLMPRLLTEPVYWKSWARMLERVLVYDYSGDSFFIRLVVAGVAFIILSAALLALLTVVGRRGTAILTGLWVGYALFGLLFTYHIHTHEYYSLPAIPIVALSIAVTGDKALQTARRWLPSRAVGLAAILSVAVMLGVASILATPRLIDPAYRQTVERYQHIGHLTEAKKQALFLDRTYGTALVFHGRIPGRYWPSIADLRYEHLLGLEPISTQERFATQNPAYWPAPATMSPQPDTFIVTDLAEFNAQPALRQFLFRTQTVIAQTDTYVIFGLKPVP